MTEVHPSTCFCLSSVEDEGLGEGNSRWCGNWRLAPRPLRGESPQLAAFDPPRVFDAFPGCRGLGFRFQCRRQGAASPFRSGVEVDDYQLDPVVRALSMPRVNLLVADDVGLGKTIEAGLVMQELMLRHRARSILIVCPSSIQVQWRRRCVTSSASISGSSTASCSRAASSPRHPRQSCHFPRLITSIDFSKRERPMRLFRETLPAGDQPAYPASPTIS